MNPAESMRRLRAERVEDGLCTRCGKNEPKRGKRICSECREYLDEYNKNKKSKKEPVIIRDLKRWDVTNKRLYSGLIDMKMTTKELAERVGVTPRSVDSWIFEGVEPRYEDRKATINQVLNKRIYDI